MLALKSIKRKLIKIILKVKTQNPAMEMSLIEKKNKTIIKTFQGSPGQCTLCVRTAKQFHNCHIIQIKI